MFSGFIYRAISPIGKKYYGKSTKDLANVKKRHFNRSKEKAYKFANVIKKYGIDNFKWEIVESFSFNNKQELNITLNEREIYWIKLDKTTINEYGYNTTKGGDGGDTFSNHPNKDEIIKKRSFKNKGRKRSKEFCENARQIALNIDPEIRKKAGKKSAETRRKRILKNGFTEKELAAQEKNKAFLINLNKTTEARNRVSKQWKGKKKPPMSEETRKKIGMASKGRKIPGRPVIIEGKEYDSLHDASRKLKIPLNTLRNRLLSNNFKAWNYKS